MTIGRIISNCTRRHAINNSGEGVCARDLVREKCGLLRGSFNGLGRDHGGRSGYSYLRVTRTRKLGGGLLGEPYCYEYRGRGGNCNSTRTYYLIRLFKCARRKTSARGSYRGVIIGRGKKRRGCGRFLRMVR